MTRVIALVVLAVAACAPEGPPVRPLAVSCDAAGLVDHTQVHVILRPDPDVPAGRLLVRVDSLRSSAGPTFDADSGFLIQAFTRVGPGRGCATISPVGARVQGFGESLARSWIHVKSDRPVRVYVATTTGDVLAEEEGRAGEVVEPMTWDAR